MDTCDVLIAGGGPAGSACAWKLRQAGLDVIIIDKATFPRDKVCAGWITPQVVDDLEIDVDDYRSSRTFQPITGFRVGLIGQNSVVETEYDRPVSFGIRRCEFDHYLLQRSGVLVRSGTPVSSMRREGRWWIVNDSLKAAVVVGAGGHFCPVARMQSVACDAAPLIAAQEVEFPVDPHESFTTLGETPELYFCPDLKGYGWCFRKQGHLNIGFGRLDGHALPRATAAFLDFLKARGTVPADAAWRWRGHAYLLSGASGRQPVGDGILLVGDAAGLAYPQSGEGIRPAIESGLMAATAIRSAEGRYTRDRLEGYERDLHGRFGVSRASSLLTRIVPGTTAIRMARRFLESPWFVRHMVLDRWFLHAHEPALSRSLAASVSIPALCDRQ